MDNPEQNMCIVLAIVSIVFGVCLLIARIKKARRQRADRDLLAAICHSTATAFTPGDAATANRYPYEYEHKIENDNGTTTTVLYLFNIKLLSDFSAFGTPEWEMQDVIVAEIDGQPICRDEALPYLFIWEESACTLAEADLELGGGPKITDFVNYFNKENWNARN